MLQIFLVNQNSQQLDDAKRRVSIIQLNGCLGGEIFPFELLFPQFGVGFVPPDNILNRSRNEQVLLFESELFALFGRIVGVQDTRDVFGFLSIF